jgi:hypothetical protein
MRKKHLHVKGWSEEEIIKAERIFNDAEKKKHPHVRHLEKSLYWFTLATGIIGTVLFSFVLIPIFMISNNTWSFILTGMFGFLLGTVIIIIVKDLHWLEQHHHLFISLTTPIIAIFNFFIVVNRVNILVYTLGLKYIHDPIMLGITYFICFLIPYGAFMIYKRNQSWT